MDRYVCIHGHFYQPPRENAWIESIELQDSAYPFHDWNERITAECYASNAVSRILDADNWIVQLVNNYARISFNFGPTLLSWLEVHAPNTYRAILEADRESVERFDGHGSALAQAYNHMILPLAHPRDKRCQIVWGLRDFEHRFGRRAEGMWLPETAVDLETLQLLAEHGIRFTVLAPNQARRVRPAGGRRWRDLVGGRIDPTTAYEQRLRAGRSIALFFYDGPVSRAVAFERLLERGETFAGRILGIFNDARDWPQLAHIATDGETYGHHHRHGEMALSYALNHIETNGLARLTNYGAYLAKHPPRHQVEIFEHSSWSCAHGVERWKADCGCHSGRPAWNQRWRAPLREALDRLRDRLASLYEEHAGELLRDPWAAREDYIEVILDRSTDKTDRWLADHVARQLTLDERIRVWKLLEMQRHAMLMYTSCGWFFDELSGIETVQVIQYGARALQLAREVTGQDLEGEFLEGLERAPSNLPEHGNGRAIYEKFVRPATVDLRKVGAHYAVSLLFESYETRDRIYGYRIDREEHEVLQEGGSKLALGRLYVTSEITGESALLIYGVLRFGDHNLTGGVREFRDEESYAAMLAEIREAFARADLPEVVRRLDRHLELTYSLKSLFRDEQRRILDEILAATLADAGTVFRQLYERHSPLMHFLADLGIPQPETFRATGEFVLNQSLREAIQHEPLDPARIEALVATAREESMNLDRAGHGLALQRVLERAIDALGAAPEDLARLEEVERIAALARRVPLEVNLWRVQNAFYELLRERWPLMAERAGRGDEHARSWVERLRALGGDLRVRVPAERAQTVAS